MFCHGGACQPDGIDAQMMAEAAVLDGDESIGDIGGQILGLHHLALSQAAARDLPSAIVQQGDVLRGARQTQIANIGQTRKKVREEQSGKITPQAHSITST